MNYEYSFERLKAWELAIELAEDVYVLSKGFPEEEKYGLTRQIRRAVVSISSNLAEGSSRYSFKEKAHYTSIAFGSLMELISQMTLTQRFGWIDEDQIQLFREKANRLAYLISKLRESQIAMLKEPTIEYQITPPSPISPSSPISPISPAPPNDSTVQHLNDSTIQHPNDSTDQHPNDSTIQQFNDSTLNNPYFQHKTALIDQGAVIGGNSKIWHFSHIMGGAKIGQNCNIGQNVFIASGVTLGNNVKVQNNVSIYEGVVCADDVFLGPSMVFTNVINPRSAVSRKDEYKPTRVGKGASIGANATIICGNQIGKYAFVGAGAVVTKAVADFALVVGNPAQQIGWMSARGHRLEFDEAGEAECPEGGETYVLVEERVEKVEGGKARSSEQ